MMFVGPISFRKRDARVSALIRRGHATDDELFEAQFGQWPVNGLEKDTPRDQNIYFKGYLSGSFNVAALPFTMAFINPDEPDRTIHINRLTLNPLSPITSLLASRMALARAHTLLEPLIGVEFLRAFSVVLFAASLASSYRYAAASSITKVLAPSVADYIGEEQIHIHQFKDGGDTYVRRAFLNDALNIAESFTGFERFSNQTHRTVDALLTLMPREYFSQDHELQARLHNLMVRGYKGWGRIPSNEDELIVALADMGIRRPRVVNEYIADDGQKGAREIFQRNAQSGYIAGPAAEMNIGIGSFHNNEILHRFWARYLPLLYGDLLVKYGDSHGLERMGYGKETGMMGMPLRKASSPLDTPPQPF